MKDLSDIKVKIQTKIDAEQAALTAGQQAKSEIEAKQNKDGGDLANANQARALVSSAETVYGMLSNARSILASANPPIQPAALAGLEAALLGIESQADGFVDQATALAEPSETYP